MMLKKIEITSVKPRLAARMFAPTKLAIALASVVAVQAFAHDYPRHSFGLSLRSDLQVNFSDSKLDVNGNEESRRFSNHTTKLNFQGPLDGMTSYRIRFNLGKTGDIEYPVDIERHSDQVDYAYIDRTIMGAHKIRVGKLSIGGGGREGDYGSEDVYLTSVAGGLTENTRLGVAFMPSVAGQDFTLSLVNGADLTEENQSQFGYGLAWSGSFADGMVQPIASYAMLNSTKQKDPQVKKSATDTYYAIGARVNLDMAMFEADYIGVEQGARFDTNEDVKSSSIVLLAQAKLMDNRFRPHIKYEMSKMKESFTKATNADDEDKDRKAFTVALEYYPNGGKRAVDWRVHAAYTQYKDDYNKYNADLEDETVSQFLLGFSVNFTNG